MPKRHTLRPARTSPARSPVSQTPSSADDARDQGFLWTANSNLGIGGKIGTGKIRLRAQMSDAPLSEDLGWIEDAIFKIIAEGDAFKGPENLKGAVDQVAKLAKMTPVKGQAPDPAGIWDDTPPLIYWARFEAAANVVAKKRQLLITESESYAQDAVEAGERIVYAARMPL